MPVAIETRATGAPGGAARSLNLGVRPSHHVDDSDESGVVDCLVHEGPQGVRVAHDEGDLWTVVVDRCTACSRKGSGPCRAILTVSESSPRDSGFPANVSRCSAQDFKDDVLACVLRQVDRMITIEAGWCVPRGLELLRECLGKRGGCNPFPGVNGFYDRHGGFDDCLCRGAVLRSKTNAIEITSLRISDNEDVKGLHYVAEHSSHQRGKARRIRRISRCGCRFVCLEAAAQGIAAGPKAGDRSIFNAFGRGR
jgi:hypothetical protein